MRAAGAMTSFAAGAVWGVAFWSWALPIPLVVRPAATLLLVGSIVAASGPGMVAAASFLFGMGSSSALLLGSNGQLLTDWWGLVPAGALLGGAGLVISMAIGPSGRTNTDCQ